MSVEDEGRPSKAGDLDIPEVDGGVLLEDKSGTAIDDSWRQRTRARLRASGKFAGASGEIDFEGESDHFYIVMHVIIIVLGVLIVTAGVVLSAKSGMAWLLVFLGCLLFLGGSWKVFGERADK